MEILKFQLNPHSLQPNSDEVIQSRYRERISSLIWENIVGFAMFTSVTFSGEAAEDVS